MSQIGSSTSVGETPTKAAVFDSPAPKASPTPEKPTGAYRRLMATKWGKPLVYGGGIFLLVIFLILPLIGWMKWPSEYEWLQGNKARAETKMVSTWKAGYDLTSDITIAFPNTGLLITDLPDKVRYFPNASSAAEPSPAAVEFLQINKATFPIDNFQGGLAKEIVPNQRGSTTLETIGPWEVLRAKADDGLIHFQAYTASVHASGAFTTVGEIQDVLRNTVPVKRLIRPTVATTQPHGSWGPSRSSGSGFRSVD